MQILDFDVSVCSFFFCSNQVLDEIERSLHDALCVLSQTVNDSRVLLGGGWPEMVMAKAVDEKERKWTAPS